MEQNFFKKINYSASNEDSDSELTALRISNQDIVLCISGSGARALDLLVDGPKKIISIDFNASQNYLLELKIAAYKALNYPNFCSFIGLEASKDRKGFYEQVKPLLSVDAVAYWNAHLKLIEDRVLYCGTWENFLRTMQKLSYARSTTLSKIFKASTLKEQGEIWDKEWDNWLWKGYLKIISNRFLWTKIIREPGSKLIPKDFDVYAYTYERLNHLAHHFDLKTNHFANLIFLGKYSNACVLPHHLRQENFEIIKRNLDKIEVVTGSLNDYLSTQKNSIDAFSLSDFSSYAPEPVYHEIWKSIIEAARPKARFCERQYLVKRNPEKLDTVIQRDALLEEELNKTDEAFIYSFCVGRICK